MKQVFSNRIFSDAVERKIKVMYGYCPYYWNGAEAVPYSQQQLGRCPLFDSIEEVEQFFKENMEPGFISRSWIKYFETSEFC